MTKERDEMSFEDAVMRVGSKLGWPRAAKVVFKTERHVRNWSDPDERGADVDSALALDLAYHRETGGKPPILSAYIHQFEREAGVSVCQDALNDMMLRLARESAEAVAAGMGACHPNATDLDKRVALKELSEQIDAAVAMRDRLAAELSGSVTPINRVAS